MVEVNFGHRSPDAVVAIDRVPELRGWRHATATAVRARRRAHLHRDARRRPGRARCPALAEAARTVGSPQIRNAGTLGGNLGTVLARGRRAAGAGRRSTPSSSWPSAGGAARAAASHDFMVGVKRTALGAGELIVAVTVPVLDGSQGFAKVGRAQRHGDLGASALPRRRPCRRGRCALALGSVGPDRRAGPRGRGVAGRRSSTGTAAARRPRRGRASSARWPRPPARPIDDHRSTAAYRRHAVGGAGRAACCDRAFAAR